MAELGEISAYGGVPEWGIKENGFGVEWVVKWSCRQQEGGKRAADIARRYIPARSLAGSLLAPWPREGRQWQWQCAKCRQRSPRSPHWSLARIKKL